MDKKSGKKPITKKWWFWVVVVLLAWGVIGSALGYGKGKEADPVQAAPADTAEPAAPEQAVTSEGEVSTEPKIPYGELLSVNVNDDNVAIVKAKITSSWNSKTTIDQNYYNVVDLISKYGFDQYAEIQYWAVADMSDGSEQKVVSFTVPGSVIATIAATENFPANTLGDYVTDLWVHQSLRD